MRDDEALGILSRFYDPAARAFAMLKRHGELVGGKALAAAVAVPHLAPDPDFIRSAALLHDVGIFLTRSPRLGRPSDIASMVAMLVSDEGEWITGQVLGVNGGALI